MQMKCIYILEVNQKIKTKIYTGYQINRIVDAVYMFKQLYQGMPITQ